MELSSKSEYALLALFELASCYESGDSLQIQQIADAQDIPKRYLEQLLASLRRGGLIKSTRGVRGGYVLAKDPRHTTVLDALKCIEGIDTISPDDTNSTCATASGVIKHVWKLGQEALYDVLQDYTLQDLCDLQDKQTPATLMYYI
jgi:Rrf2 family protein